jgi:hypothetical protein
MNPINEYLESKMFLTEDIRSKDFETARSLIVEYLEKYGIYSMPNLDRVYTNKGHYYGNLVFNVKTNKAAYIIWREDADMNDSMSVSGVLFFNDAVQAVAAGNSDGITKLSSTVNVRTNGVSIAKLLPLIKGILTGDVRMDQNSIDGAVAGYGIMVEESAADDVQTAYKAKDKAYNRWKYLRDTMASKEDIDAAEQEYRRLTDVWKSVKLSVTGGSVVQISSGDEIANEEKEMEQRLDPKVRFQHMYNYINMVLKGISNGLIISGAPGIGKTHNVKKLIKQTGYQLGDNYQLISGRCTPAALYLGLYNYSREDDITLIDDCDDALTDTNAVNILKAALDSGDERILSYFVSTTPEVTEEDAVMRHPELVPDKKGKYHAPRQFEYNGRIIIITNMYAGSLDTALRNRCIVCNLDFTTEETLGIVKDIMPNIMPNRLDNKSKDLAYNFLQELADKKSEMEISIRSFTTVAKIFAVCGDTDDARLMCMEQMKLQYARPGKRKRY